MYHLIGPPDAINDPDTFLVAAEGISVLAESFLNIGTDLVSRDRVYLSMYLRVRECKLWLGYSPTVLV